jgi:hypothetical protein
MKRVQLIEMGILVLALVLLYQFIIAFIAFIVGFFFMMSTNIGREVFTFELIIPLLLYFCAIYLLVATRKSLARVLNGRKDEDTFVAISLSGRQLLHTAIIVICVIVLLNELPPIISEYIGNKGSHYYRDGSENGLEIEQRMTDSYHISSIIRVVLTIVFAFLARWISNIWSNKQVNPAN